MFYNEIRKIALNVFKRLKKALKKDAAKNERSLSGQIIYILKKHLSKTQDAEKH